MYCVLEGVAKWLLNIITEYAVFKWKRNLLYSYCLLYCTLRVHCSPRNLFKVHNEIHNIPKPREALPSQVFQVVAKSNQRAKGWQRAHFASRPDHKRHIRSPKGTVPSGRGLSRTLSEWKSKMITFLFIPTILTAMRRDAH